VRSVDIGALIGVSGISFLAGVDRGGIGAARGGDWISTGLASNKRITSPQMCAGCLATPTSCRGAKRREEVGLAEILIGRFSRRTGFGAAAGGRNFRNAVLQCRCETLLREFVWSGSFAVRDVIYRRSSNGFLAVTRKNRGDAPRGWNKPCGRRLISAPRLKLMRNRPVVIASGKIAGIRVASHAPLQQSQRRTSWN